MSTGLVKSPRFLADENLQSAIVAGVRRKRPGIIFQTAATASTLGMDDVSVLQRAKELNLILMNGKTALSIFRFNVHHVAP